MSNINFIFDNIHKLIHEEAQCDFLTIITSSNSNDKSSNSNNPPTNYKLLKAFLGKIINEINNLIQEVKHDNTVLISVKNQKLLRTCYQLVASVGICTSLLPGLGISLSKRSSNANVLPHQDLSDSEKYEILTECTDFLTKSYEVPVLKNIILTFHLSDYLAALLQLSFAPLKKPGSYNNFIMTEELYNQLLTDRQRYRIIYDNLVSSCFQPILMKELLVLQSVQSPDPPVFVKRVIAKELSQRLLKPGGLLSLIRCFTETYAVDTAFEWKKIDMICKIVAGKHGNDSLENYLSNIANQLKGILTSNNPHYLATAVSCALTLNKKYPDSVPIMCLVQDIFQTFHYDALLRTSLPGTIVLTTQEIDHSINIVHACLCATKVDIPMNLLSPNIYLIFMLGIRCSKDEEVKVRIKDILLKYFEYLHKEHVLPIMQMLLFGAENKQSTTIIVEEFETGLCMKCVGDHVGYPINEALVYFYDLVNATSDNNIVQIIFETALQMLVEVIGKRNEHSNCNCDNFDVLDEVNSEYAVILKLLTELCTSPKIISTLKEKPTIVLPFIENMITSETDSNEECVTISLVLLNTILSHSTNMETNLIHLIPILKKMAKSSSSFNHVLCKETLSLLSSEHTGKTSVEETPCMKAISEVFDDLLPVRAHGIVELTKLINNRDTEAVSKKHYIFCIFQEQLKDIDSYIYLSAINGIAALGTHCTDDVLQVLCKEFLQLSCQTDPLQTSNDQNNTAELRMKIGDIIVKVTRNLGEMAVNHKTLLLNTMLCGCRDDDPLIRTSALSNLAEISRVLHYKMGTIIYEVLLCVWNTIDSDEAIECRRAAVMVISSLLNGLGKETLLQLKDNLLPIYRTLKKLYRDPNEDSVVRLHAQIALEELNNAVTDFLTPELKMENPIFVINKSDNSIN